jgi:RluA family pseudouridine synthase
VAHATHSKVSNPRQSHPWHPSQCLHPTVSALIKLSWPATLDYWEIPVLFEDDHLLALDKPGGLPTSPDRCDPQQPNLMKLLHSGITERASWAQQRRLEYLMNGHRLDAETSGVLLLVKTKPALVALANLFGSEKPIHHYVALARGSPREERIEINVGIGPDPVRMGLMRVDSRLGKRSRTSVRVAERFPGYALLHCEPQPCRTHQIRVHLRHAGLPLVGDPLYGGPPLFLSQLKRDYHAKKNRPERPLMGRVALHAEELRLPHPVTGETLVVTAPWPKDLTVAVKYLRRFGGNQVG